MTRTTTSRDHTPVSDQLNAEAIAFQQESRLRYARPLSHLLDDLDGIYDEIWSILQRAVESATHGWHLTVVGTEFRARLRDGQGQTHLALWSDECEQALQDRGGGAELGAVDAVVVRCGQTAVPAAAFVALCASHWTVV